MRLRGRMDRERGALLAEKSQVLLTSSKEVGVVDDSVVEASSRQEMLPRAAVVVHVKVVVLLGHVDAVTGQNGEGQGSASILDAMR